MIWNKRNEAQLGAPRPDPASLARKTTAHALEYVETNFGSLTWVPDIFCCFVLYRNFFFPLSLYFGCFGDLDGYSVDLDITEAFILLPLLLVLVGGISSSLYWLLQLYTFCDWMKFWRFIPPPPPPKKKKKKKNCVHKRLKTCFEISESPFTSVLYTLWAYLVLGQLLVFSFYVRFKKIKISCILLYLKFFSIYKYILSYF